MAEHLSNWPTKEERQVRAQEEASHDAIKKSQKHEYEEDLRQQKQEKEKAEKPCSRQC